MGYINDADFANNWVRSRTRSRGLAPSVLRRELTLKGVDRDLIDAAVEEIDPKDSDRRARELAEKKMRSLLGVSTQVAIRRIASQLQRKGYPPGMSLVIARDVAGSSDDTHDFHDLDH
jgi:regulatory protein